MERSVGVRTMSSFVARFLLTAFGLWIADALFVSIALENAGTLWVAAFILGVVNLLVRPIVVLLTLPITILTLGFFLLVVNGAMVLLAARIVPAFHVGGLSAGVVTSVIITLTNWIAGSALRGERKRDAGRR